MITLLPFLNKTLGSFNLRNHFPEMNPQDATVNQINNLSVNVESSVEHGDCPSDNVIAHCFENTHPAIGKLNAGIHRIKVEQAHTEARCKAYKRKAGQQIKGVESWIGIEWHDRILCTVTASILILPKFPLAINGFFVKFSRTF